MRRVARVLLALAPAALAACCCGGVPEVRLDGLRKVGEQDDPGGGSLVVEVVTDQDLIALEAERGFSVQLVFGVDGNPDEPVERLTFGAIFIPGENGRVTRWAVPVIHGIERPGPAPSYSLVDMRDHVLTFRLRGFKGMGWCSWSSNPAVLKVSRTR